MAVLLLDQVTLHLLLLHFFHWDLHLDFLVLHLWLEYLHFDLLMFRFLLDKHILFLISRCH